MIKFINDALKHRNGEKGFSLVELIVVVAILGILVVIAIPVFGAIQQSARENTVATAAANGATSIAATVTSNSSAAATTRTAAITATLADLNRQGGTDVRYILGAAGAAGAQAVTAGTSGDQTAGWKAGSVTRPALAAGVNDSSTDNVYVFAMNSRGEWAGAGTAGASTKGTDSTSGR